MLKCSKCNKGTYYAYVMSLRKYKGRYKLLLYVSEFDDNILIDIHDSLCETIGTSYFKPEIIKNIYYNLPSKVRVTNINYDYWQIENEDQILSNAISISL